MTQAKFDTTFKTHYLRPKHWGSWFLLFLLFIFSYIPVRLRDRFAGFIASKIYSKKFLNKT